MKKSTKQYDCATDGNGNKENDVSLSDVTMPGKSSGHFFVNIAFAVAVNNFWRKYKAHIVIDGLFLLPK